MSRDGNGSCVNLTVSVVTLSHNDAAVGRGKTADSHSGACMRRRCEEEDEDEDERTLHVPGKYYEDEDEDEDEDERTLVD